MKVHFGFCYIQFEGFLGWTSIYRLACNCLLMMLALRILIVLQVKANNITKPYFSTKGNNFVVVLYAPTFSKKLTCVLVEHLSCALHSCQFLRGS